MRLFNEKSVFFQHSPCFLSAFCVLFLPFSEAFSWKSCSENSNNDVIQVKDLKVSPEILSLDGSVTLSARVEVREDLNGSLRVQTELEKSSGLLHGQPIPCHGKFGSCTYSNACTEFLKLCPIPSGIHTVPAYTIKLPHMSAFIRWLAEGHYSGRITVKDAQDKQLACVSLSMDVIP